jgi:hypothetical protein
MEEKSIQRMIKDIQEEKGCARLDIIQPIALDLILHARTHPDWDKFISHFVDNDNPELATKQLARLRLEDDKKDLVYIRRTVAYLLANSMCGCDTGHRLNENIDGWLDSDISDVTVQAVKQRADERNNPA